MVELKQIKNIHKNNKMNNYLDEKRNKRRK